MQLLPLGNEHGITCYSLYEPLPGKREREKERPVCVCENSSTFLEGGQGLVARVKDGDSNAKEVCFFFGGGKR